jgi:hypothetical protein
VAIEAGSFKVYVTHKAFAKKINPDTFFFVGESPRDNTAGNGSSFVLFVKDDEDYADSDRGAYHHDTGDYLITKRVQGFRLGGSDETDAEGGNQKQFQKIAWH